LLHLAEATSGIAYALSFMGPSAASAAIAAYRHLLCTGAGLQVEEQVVTRPPQCERLVVQGRARSPHSGHQHPDHHRLRRRLRAVAVASISPLLDIHVILKK
jgi:hypothetical protein